MSLGKILAVDDDRNLVALLQMRLEAAGYEVITAFNELEALGRAKEQMIDLSSFPLCRSSFLPHMEASRPQWRR